MTLASNITDLSAGELSQAIHARLFSCHEVMAAYLERIHKFNPAFNAIVNLADDATLLGLADDCDAELMRGDSRGWLHGIPIAIKDAANAKGFPTTFGSVTLKNAVAAQDNIMVARMRTAGGIVIGKTNMPEFGLGSHTFNDLFGATCNPWDRSVSAGGSSGDAAAALALRMLPVADGSDYMGSLRNPAGWNNIFGMRPSQGRVPLWPAADVWLAQLVTEGPMARNVSDVAKLLATQAGHDLRAPLSIREPLQQHRREPAELRGLRVAWLGDLDHHLAMETGVMETVEQSLARMSAAGTQIEQVSIGFDPERIWKAWLIWRHALVGGVVAAALQKPDARDLIKPEALWEYEQSKDLGLRDFVQASQTRTAFYAHICDMFERFDVLALPTAQTWPFPMEQRWPETIAGRRMSTYHRWMEVTLYATFAGLPAISVPAGFHPNGRWPIGLQLIGRPCSDAHLLRVAADYEALIPDLLCRRPSEQTSEISAV